MKLARLQDSLGRLARERSDDAAIQTDAAVWTYRDLWRSSEAAAARLAGTELRAGARVAVLANKSAETIALLLALGARGHTPLIVSPTLGSAAKAAVFDHAKVDCELAATDSPGPGEDFDIRFLPRRTLGPGGAPADAGDVPLLLTTSGTTGVPKAVELACDGVARFLDWSQAYFGIGPGTRVLSYAPLNFDLSLLEVWSALDCGAVVILANSERMTDGNYLRRMLQKTAPDIIQAVPLFFNLLVQAHEAGHLTAGVRPPRHIVLTGDVVPRRLRRKLARVFPEARFHNLYGCTETNDSLIHSCTPGEVAERPRLPIGKPIEGVTVRVVEVDGSVLEGAGQGELWVCTPFQARGYTDEDLTNEAFVEIEGPQGVQRFYRTVDKVERDEDGTLHLIGRIDLVVKVRGVRTNLQDVERVLNLHPFVLNAVVVPVSDHLAGSSLHAFVQSGRQEPIGSLELRKHCAEHLPVTAVPSGFSISSSPLPSTSTGKPDRNRLASQIQTVGEQD